MAQADEVISKTGMEIGCKSEEKEEANGTLEYERKERVSVRESGRSGRKKREKERASENGGISAG